ncbi:MAG: SnoaL-like polyketide cyclase [Rhizonema sp. NSF051]|nr:SnoaL-like polyketide cyclase [Rhizonema sp. NSF051]
MSTTQQNNLPLWVQHRDKVLEQSHDVEWRYGTPPDYTKSNENLAKESNKRHLEGSLEDIVQNLVRTFEMEVSFKNNPQEWLSIVNDQFRMSSNGGPAYTAEYAAQQGTYNLFISDTEHYKASEETFESSGQLFHNAFPNGFLWEVLEVFSGPPKIAFKWRHWGTFSGAYKDFAPTHEVVEVVGTSIAHVTDDLKILSVEHYFDNSLFLTNLTAGVKQTNQQQGIWGSIKRLWNRGEKRATTEKQASRCPFSEILN